MELKTFIEASCTNNTLEKPFLQLLLLKVCKRFLFFSDRVKKLLVYFGLYGSPLHYWIREGQGKLSYE